MNELFTNFIVFLIWVAMGIGGILLLGSVQHNSNSSEFDCANADGCQGDIGDLWSEEDILEQIKGERK